MGDLKLAREILYTQDKKLVIAKDNEIIYSSDENGIKPLFLAYKSLNNNIRGASCADRVVGKAASMIYKNLNIKSLYCDIISEVGKKILEDMGIEVTSVQVVEYIKNRDKTDMCPVEKLALNENSFENLISSIEKFLEQIKAI